MSVVAGYEREKRTAASAAGFAGLPEPPYYAVIFASRLVKSDSGYAVMADRMVELAENQSGFLGIESARGDDLLGITVSYWRDEQSIRAWKAHAEHAIAQEVGKNRWYEHYVLRVAKVERAYSGPVGRGYTG